MRLLFDQNLSPRLPARLADLFPESAHVFDLGLDQVPDEVVWDFAQANGFAVVSKDADYPDLSAVRGHPPKVVWLQLGNCTTAHIEGCLRSDYTALEAFDADPSGSVFAVR